eukprot:15359446-Ditylum_brightwellii.AAC.1
MPTKNERRYNMGRRSTWIQNIEQKNIHIPTRTAPRQVKSMVHTYKTQTEYNRGTAKGQTRRTSNEWTTILRSHQKHNANSHPANDTNETVANSPLLIHPQRTR